jgi:very-short-patch-repair endonuclease
MQRGETTLSVSGKVEKVSKVGERELGLVAGIYLVTIAGQDIRFPEGLHVRPGDNVTVQTVRSKDGALAQSVEKIDSTDITAHNDYAGLLAECKTIVERAKKSAEDFVKANWELGRRLVGAETTYGEGTVQKLADDLGVSKTYLYNCIGVAEKYKEPITFTKFHSVENLTWKGLVKSTVNHPRSAQPVIKESATPSLPHNEPATPQELVEAYRTGPPKGPDTKDTGPELQLRYILENLKDFPSFVTQLPVETKNKPRVPDVLVLSQLDIEADSKFHDPDDDKERDEDLRSVGIETLRLNSVRIQVAHDVIKDIRQAVGRIQTKVIAQ